nr:MAG TPA: hypothetical protein [Caudoviricetes sp.]
MHLSYTIVNIISTVLIKKQPFRLFGPQRVNVSTLLVP